MRRSVLLHGPAIVLYAALAIVWTWPLARHFRDHIPGLPGDNFSFLWNLWWMRKALGSAELEFFRSTYLFSPFGVDLVNHPHTALQGYLSATLLAAFLFVHMANHLAALHSIEAHQGFMAVARSVYRDAVFEPLLLAAVFVQSATGIFQLRAGNHFIRSLFRRLAVQHLLDELVIGAQQLDHEAKRIC